MNDWIEWNGGEQPVKDGTLVMVKFRGDLPDDNHEDLAETWYWFDDGEDCDIIAYKIVE
jgi:hypothetical protein